MLKYLKFLVPATIVLPCFFFIGAPLTGCQKTVDTLIVHKTDTLTIVKNDTTHSTDTVYDITSGLVAYYNFNGGSLHDSSGYKNDIIFNNATPTADRLGRANNAYLFDGATNYMQVHNSPSLNPDNITLHAIVKFNGFYHGLAHANFVLVKGWDQALGMYIIQCSDFVNPTGQPDTLHESFDLGYGDNNNNPSTVASLGPPTGTNYVVANTWYKLTYTYDGITAKLYINGVLVNSLVKTASFTDNTQDLYFGRSMDANNNTIYPFWFNGVIDEIRIYNRALPQQAVAQLVSLTN